MTNTIGTVFLLFFFASNISASHPAQFETLIAKSIENLSSSHILVTETFDYYSNSRFFFSNLFWMWWIFLFCFGNFVSMMLKHFFFFHIIDIFINEKSKISSLEMFNVSLHHVMTSSTAVKNMEFEIGTHIIAGGSDGFANANGNFIGSMDLANLLHECCINLFGFFFFFCFDSSKRK